MNTGKNSQLESRFSTKKMVTEWKEGGCVLFIDLNFGFRNFIVILDSKHRLMSKKKFILLSILKTWFFSTVVSTALLIVFMNLTRQEVGERPRNCDMSGLAYGLVIIWILFLSITAFSSLLSLLRSFQSKIKTALCWFLLPVLFIIYYFFMITEGQKISGEDILFFLMANFPWFTLWIFFYYRFIQIEHKGL